MSRLTLISHFWNEEFLLPYWLRHHREIFDHGILLDYASTDASVEIIRELTPGWEVRRTRNPDFGAGAVDQEVMEVEREVRGWKITLNTTEFLLHPQLKLFLRWMERYRNDVRGIWAKDVVMVEHPAEAHRPITDAPLHEQREYGYFANGERSRILHCAADGQYGVGRHSSGIVPKVLDDEILLLWYGWCPDHTATWARKLAIQQRIPDHDKAGGLGHQHLVDEAVLRQRYGTEIRQSYHLMTNTRYQEVISEVRSGGHR